MNQLRIEAQIEWRFSRDRHSDHWIAVCTALGQTVSAETWAELNANIAETLDLLFHDLFETGELEDFLKSHGWYMTKSQPDPSKNVRFDVPWQMVERQGAYDKEGTLC